MIDAAVFRLHFKHPVKFIFDFLQAVIHTVSALGDAGIIEQPAVHLPAEEQIGSSLCPGYDIPSVIACVMPASADVDLLIRAVYDGRFGMTGGVRIDSGIFRIEFRAAALQIQHAECLAQQGIIDLPADGEGGGFRTILGDQFVDAVCSQSGKIGNTVCLTGIGILCRCRKRSFQHGLSGIRLHNRETLRFEIGEDSRFDGIR